MTACPICTNPMTRNDSLFLTVPTSLSMDKVVSSYFVSEGTTVQGPDIKVGVEIDPVTETLSIYVCQFYSTKTKIIEIDMRELLDTGAMMDSIFTVPSLYLGRLQVLQTAQVTIS